MQQGGEGGKDLLVLLGGSAAECAAKALTPLLLSSA